MTTFYVEIEMGNAAMQDNNDIKFALLGIAVDIIERPDKDYIKDINGNTVGHYGYRD